MKIQHAPRLSMGLLEVMGGTHAQEKPQPAPKPGKAKLTPEILDLATQRVREKVGAHIFDLGDWAGATLPTAEGSFADWMGGVSDGRYPSQSEADQALCGHAARELVALEVTDQDELAEGARAIMERSALSQRPKWERADYSDRTITKAVTDALASKPQARKGADSLTPQGQAPSLDNVHGNHADLFFAAVIAAVAGDSFKFVHGAEEWIKREDETGWIKAPPYAEVVMAKRGLEFIKGEAMREFQADPGSAKTKKLTALVSRCSTLPRIQAAIELAKAEPGMTILLTEVDADPYKLGLVNGVYDLRRDRMLGHDHGDIVTKRTNLRYDPLATCPMFDAFFERILPDKAVRDCLLRFFGSCLTGMVTDHVLFWLHGHGGNGKTTLIELIAYLMGDYAYKAPTELFTHHKRNPQSPSPDLLALYGRRLVFASETSEGVYFDEARVKELSGGDTISARGVHSKHFVNFTPTHKIVLTGNYDPLVSDVSYGFWRRMAKTPFTQTIPVEERDQGLQDKLRSEAPGIFNRLLDGWREYRKIGLSIPAQIIAATKAYQEDQDLVREFLHESGRVDLKPNGQMEKSALYLEYRNWADQSGLRPMSQKSLTRRLAGHSVVQDPGRRKFLGIAPATMTRPR